MDKACRRKRSHVRAGVLRILCITFAAVPRTEGGRFCNSLSEFDTERNCAQSYFALIPISGQPETGRQSCASLTLMCDSYTINDLTLFNR